MEIQNLPACLFFSPQAGEVRSPLMGFVTGNSCYYWTRIRKFALRKSRNER